MNLNTIRSVSRPARLQEIPSPIQTGDSWLAGGTWLFSEPQLHLTRLIDLTRLDWESLSVSEDGLHIGATCTIAELYAFEAPVSWTTAPLIRQCCRSFQSSFKIWNAATVGGNICLSLPAGPMISLVAALDGTGTVIGLDGEQRSIPIASFVTGIRHNVLRSGELLRSVFISAAALQREYAFRRMSLTRTGRSSVLLIGTFCRERDEFVLTITAATVKPVQIRFEGLPERETLDTAIANAVPEELQLDDPHGSSDHRRHLTFHFAEEIRLELGGRTPVARGVE